MFYILTDIIASVLMVYGLTVAIASALVKLLEIDDNATGWRKGLNLLVRFADYFSTAYPKHRM